MFSSSKSIPQVILSEVLAGAGREAGADLYKKIKEFILSLPDEKQNSLINTSFEKPSTFLAFEVNRFSNKAASILLTMPRAERERLVKIARYQTGDDDQIVFNLLKLLKV